MSNTMSPGAYKKRLLPALVTEYYCFCFQASCSSLSQNHSLPEFAVTVIFFCPVVFLHRDTIMSNGTSNAPRASTQSPSQPRNLGSSSGWSTEVAHGSQTGSNHCSDDHTPQPAHFEVKSISMMDHWLSERPNEGPWNTEVASRRETNA